MRNPKYKKNKKNGGNIPPVRDERHLWVAVGCQQCIECKKQKANGWRVRLLEDIKKHRNGHFVTLTFKQGAMEELSKKYEIEPDGYEFDNRIATIAIRLYRGRHRKRTGKEPRHWLVTELGHKGTERIHLHGIIWTDEPEKIQQEWQYGWVWKGRYMGEGAINYMVKYFHKRDHDHPGYNSIILSSKGIGKNYTQTGNIGQWTKNKFNGTETKETYKTSTGGRLGLPNYWRNKIYSENQREELWSQKLDEGTRYVLGKKCRNPQEYETALIAARAKNKRLGYGESKTQEKDEYERIQRILKQKKQLQSAASRTG